MLTSVILAGGTGTRIWPLSRKDYPKQFHRFGENVSLLQSTIARVSGLSDTMPFVICHHQHRFLLAEQLQSLKSNGQIVLEPASINTAAAIASCCIHLIDESDNQSYALADPIVLVLPADHFIDNEDAFRNAISAAQKYIDTNTIITFGVVPDRPETAYGYIKTETNLAKDSKFSNDASIHPISQFVEKPNLGIAQEYIESGNYLWNSGMFMAKASVFIALYKSYQSDIYESCKAAVEKLIVDLDFIRLDANGYMNCPSISFDHGIMEPLCSDPNATIKAMVIPIDCGWSDLGSWNAIHDHLKVGSDQNTLIGNVVVRDSSNCLVKSDDRLVTILGLQNIAVVDTKDALLVADLSRVQEVKQLVSLLEEQGRQEVNGIREVFRPWGKYEIIQTGPHHQIKKVQVKPGSRLSLQRHQHRAEHWVVVSGIATVINGDNHFTIRENESTYIPLGNIHSLENREKNLLEVIEVQTGSYFEEDDIERFKDEYGRA